MDSSEFYFVLFWVALLIFGVLYSSRKAAASLVKAEEKKPGLLADIVYYAAKWIVIFSLLGMLPGLLMMWPPRWMERRDQRKEVFKHIEAAGGWAKLVEDTRVLLATNDSPYVRISPRWETNFALPQAISALKPRDVELSKLQGPTTALFHIFGYHSTGGRGQANYWLFIVEHDSEKKAIESLHSRFNNRTIRQITNSVFEVY